MNRIKVLFFVIIAFLFSLAACSYEDKTTYAGEPLPDIVIDTAGIPQVHVVSREDTLVIRPKVSKMGVAKENLEFEWRMTMDPGTNFSVAKVIGQEEELCYYVEDRPDASSYGLWFRVTDKTTGLMESVLWNIKVEASSGQGLVVAYTKDNRTTDFAIVQDSLFTYDYTNPETGEKRPTYYRFDVFSKKNGKTFDGVVRWMFAQARYLDRRLTYMLHGASEHNIFRINTMDYTVLQEGGEMFYDPFVKLNIEYYGLAGNYAVLSNNGRLYGLMQEQQDAGTFNKFGMDVPGEYTINGHISDYSNLAWFDEERGKFFTTSGYITYYSAPPSEYVNPIGDGGNENPLPGFDLNHMKGYELIAGGQGRYEHCFILKKDDKVGLYNIFKTTRTPFNPRRWIDISDAPRISEATSFVFSYGEDVIYYVANHAVHAILFSGSRVKYKENVYVPGEPIEFIQFLKKTGSKVVPLHMRCLLVATNGERGKIHALKMGALNTAEYTNVAVFDGFNGKITAMAVQD